LSTSLKGLSSMRQLSSAANVVDVTPRTNAAVKAADNVFFNLTASFF